MRADPSKIKVEADGPNINIKIPRKSYSTYEEKKYFFNKIKTKQKTEVILFLLSYAKIGPCTLTVISKIIVPSLMGKGSWDLLNPQKNTKLNFVKCLTKTIIVIMATDAFTYMSSSITNLIRQLRLFKYVHLLKKFSKEFISEFYKSDTDDLCKLLHIIHSKKKVLMYFLII